MAAPAHQLGPHTVAEWLSADQPEDGRRLELLWGHYMMSPAPTKTHQYAMGELYIILRDAVRTSGRPDLHVLLGVAASISTENRHGLIPDIMVINEWGEETTTEPAAMQLVVELWSSGNKKKERKAKVDAFAAAGIPFLWTVEFGAWGESRITAFRLGEGQYVEEITAKPGEAVTITAAPVPVTFDPADIVP
ncbi:hypothetical protein GCM10012275_26240 [Longimycelium tulufanense]|uniref:Putative restriction endonuclease domain-containing protein n=1 Tax=Longimycelium tulufanense TaxID=907463 RepID=A0A8J3FU05_9PSEU|nr:Uma2 family endonuclease [Longimycelium tulufanense]GGM53882.1 hypothetical protein GCM10012275_26240 [Longimycelium tulufanense]